MSDIIERPPPARWPRRAWRVGRTLALVAAVVVVILYAGPAVGGSYLWVLIAVGVAFTLLELLVQALVDARARRAVVAALAALPPGDAAAAVDLVRARLGWRASADWLAQCLGAGGLVNVTVRLAQPPQRTEALPLDVPTEPVVVEGGDPAFEALRLSGLGAAPAAAGPPPHDRSGDWLLRLWQRATIWNVIMFVFAGLEGLRCLFAQRISWQLLFLGSFLALVFLPRRGLVTLGQECWLVVPGGIAVRAATGLAYFRRVDSVLCVEHSRGDIWGVTECQGSLVQGGHFSAAETHGLLRAWRSELPPPPREQLAEFE